MGRLRGGRPWSSPSLQLVAVFYPSFSGRMCLQEMALSPLEMGHFALEMGLSLLEKGLSPLEMGLLLLASALQGMGPSPLDLGRALQETGLVLQRLVLFHHPKR